MKKEHIKWGLAGAAVIAGLGLFEIPVIGTMIEVIPKFWMGLVAGYALWKY